MTKILLRHDVFQDGQNFYYESDHREAFIVGYPGIVNGDHDTTGAAKARALFARDYPHLVR